MRTSETTADLALALSKAQSKIQLATKAAKGYNYKYARLEDYWEVCREHLSENDLAVSQFPEWNGDRVSVTTRLEHKSGQFYESTMSIKPSKDGDKEIGAAITYARKYGLSSMLCLIGTEDDPDDTQTKAIEKKSGESQANAIMNKITGEDHLKEMMTVMKLEYVTNDAKLHQIYKNLQSENLANGQIVFRVRECFEKEFRRK